MEGGWRRTRGGWGGAAHEDPDGAPDTVPRDRFPRTEREDGMDARREGEEHEIQLGDLGEFTRGNQKAQKAV